MKRREKKNKTKTDELQVMNNIQQSSLNVITCKHLTIVLAPP